MSKEKSDNVRRRIGASLFTLGAFPIEYTYYGEQYRDEWEADAVDTVGAAFLGLTVWPAPAVTITSSTPSDSAIITA